MSPASGDRRSVYRTGLDSTEGSATGIMALLDSIVLTVSPVATFIKQPREGPFLKSLRPSLCTLTVKAAWPPLWDHSERHLAAKGAEEWLSQRESSLLGTRGSEKRWAVTNVFERVWFGCAGEERWIMDHRSWMMDHGHGSRGSGLDGIDIGVVGHENGNFPGMNLCTSGRTIMRGRS